MMPIHFLLFIAQLTNGAVSGEYFIILLVAIVGTLFFALAGLVYAQITNTFKQINNQLATLTLKYDNQQGDINDLDKRQGLTDQAVKNIDTNKMAEQIIMKLRSWKELQ